MEDKYCPMKTRVKRKIASLSLSCWFIIIYYYYLQIAANLTHSYPQLYRPPLSSA
jgi:hypothetical protein